ncbi:hypothetical protein CASFOL_031462 [Castilleja foliolosa]|uniref:Uncharacterized protein n=1 Tax=Castilleja foliolosa TaxID=1961234 RepID=A0ABD3C5C2_9LAMI
MKIGLLVFFPPAPRVPRTPVLVPGDNSGLWKKLMARSWNFNIFGKFRTGKKHTKS